MAKFVPRIEVVCENPACNKPFLKKQWAYDATIKRKGKHFCSLKCSHETIRSSKLDIIGKTFNKLTCIKELPRPSHNTKNCHFLFLCSCGNEYRGSGSNVVIGRAKQCRKCSRLQTLGINNKLFTGAGEISGAWWFTHVVKGANMRKLEVDISIEEAWELFLNQNRKCRFTGLKLYFPETNTDLGTASFDRIDSSVGYIKGNVQWVYKDINIMKQAKSDKEFILLCKLVVKNCVNTK